MRDLIKRMIEDQVKPDVILGKVTAVDQESWTITVELLNGAKVENVRVRSVINDQKTGFFVEPEIDSHVILGMIQGKLESLCVLSYSQIKRVDIMAPEVNLNGDEFGGILKLKETVDNFDALKQYLSTLSGAIASALTAVGVGPAANGPGAAAAFQAQMAAQQIVYKTMENKTVKHGKGSDS